MADVVQNERGQWVTIGGELAEKPLNVRLPVEADAIVRSLPSRSEKLRQWILEGMKAEGLIKDED